MPCARLSIDYDNFTYKKEYCRHIIVIPVMTVSSSVPFRPKGQKIATFIIRWKKITTIKKTKILQIVKKYKIYMDNGFICDNDRKNIIDPLIDEVELFLKFIAVSMNWKEDDPDIFFNKELVWKTF
jgi:hypothetical protein